MPECRAQTMLPAGLGLRSCPAALPARLACPRRHGDSAAREQQPAGRRIGGYVLGFGTARPAVSRQGDRQRGSTALTSMRRLARQRPPVPRRRGQLVGMLPEEAGPQWTCTCLLHACKYLMHVRPPYALDEFRVEPSGSEPDIRPTYPGSGMPVYRSVGVKAS